MFCKINRQLAGTEQNNVPFDNYRIHFFLFMRPVLGGVIIHRYVKYLDTHYSQAPAAANIR